MNLSKAHVHALLTLPPGHNEHNCTMVLDTIRTGFPTAEVFISLNGDGHNFSESVFERCEKANVHYDAVGHEIAHFDWIGATLSYGIEQDEHTPIVFLDGDIRFWKSVEDWEVIKPLAGMFIPGHLSDLFKCYYMSRLHTSFLIVRSAPELRKEFIKLRPIHEPQLAPYTPFDPIRPHYAYFQHRQLYYDTMAAAYQAIGGHQFNEAELDCYDHLNCASFYNVMKESFDSPVNKSAFIDAHLRCQTNPDGMRGYWRSIYAYYNTRSITFEDYVHSNPV